MDCLGDPGSSITCTRLGYLPGTMPRQCLASARRTKRDAGRKPINILWSRRTRLDAYFQRLDEAAALLRSS